MSDKRERRYRRLLALYPRDHRERHGEEMLGVVLDGRPSWREGVDLVGGAIVLHLRRVLGLDGRVHRRDVLSIVSLLGPIVILSAAAGDLHEVAWWIKAGTLADMPASQIPDASAWVMWLVAAMLALFGLRQLAAIAAWSATGLYLVMAGLYANYTWSYESAGWMLLGVFTAIGLTWSPGPRRGRQLIGRRGIAYALAGDAVAVLCQLFTPRFLPVGGRVFELSEWLVFGALAAGVYLACRSVDSRRTGRRAAFVLALPAVAFTLQMVELSIVGPPLYWRRSVEIVVFYGIPTLMVLAGMGILRPVRKSLPS